MDFITQFEHTLEQAIQSELYEQANQLLAAYPSTGQPYSLHMFSLINRLRKAGHAPAHRIVLFLTGNFILDYIARQFHTFFKNQRYDVLIFNPNDYSQSTNALFSFAQKGIDAAYFFNNVGLLQTLADGRNLWETLEIPCVDFLVDHPMYYADSLDLAPSHTTLLVADRTHIAYVERFYPRVQAAQFLPTGGCDINIEQYFTRETGSANSWNRRHMDVLFIGSYKFHADYIEDSLDAYIANHLICHTDHTFEQAVELCLAEIHPNQGMTDEVLKKIIEDHRFLETNLTARYRKALIEKLVASGIDIHVYGSGWQQTGLTDYPNFHLHAPVSFQEGISLMAHTKILLNHMAWFKDGSSERIFNAMAQGAVCVTDSSIYLNDFLEDDVNCRLFSLSEILPNETKESSDRQDLASRISDLLSDPKTASEIALAGQRTASQHTWQKHLFYAIIDQ